MDLNNLHSIESICILFVKSRTFSIYVTYIDDYINLCHDNRIIKTARD